MNLTDRKLSVLAIILTIIVGVIVLFKPAKTIIQQISNGDPINPVGALAGPDIPYDYISVGGVRTFYRHMEAKKGTTTPCSFELPIGKSKVMSFAFNIASSSGITSTTWILATSTGSNSTTTVLTKRTLTNKGILSWVPPSSTSSAPSAAVEGLMYSSASAPQYLVLGAEQGGGDAATGFVIDGQCDAVIQSFEGWDVY